jgi:hypothetical protein
MRTSGKDFRASKKNVGFGKGCSRYVWIYEEYIETRGNLVHIIKFDEHRARYASFLETVVLRILNSAPALNLAHDTCVGPPELRAARPVFRVPKVAMSIDRKLRKNMSTESLRTVL